MKQNKDREKINYLLLNLVRKCESCKKINKDLLFEISAFVTNDLIEISNSIANFH
jgi:hypothetical protein